LPHKLLIRFQSVASAIRRQPGLYWLFCHHVSNDYRL
jgi:hypothetical protein